VPANGRLELIALVPTASPHVPHSSGTRAAVGKPYGLMVFDLDGGAMATITGFPSRFLSGSERGAPAVVLKALPEPESIFGGDADV